MPENTNQPEILYHWTARKMHPVVLLYLAAVFAVFIAVSYFVFHSPNAVKGLITTGFTAIVSCLPGLRSRIEYRLTERCLEKRSVNTKKPTTFQTLFQIDQISHIVPIRHGFKFYLTFNEPNPLRRFFKLHLSDKYSGEVHVESADRQQILAALAACGVPSRESRFNRR